MCMMELATWSMMTADNKIGSHRAKTCDASWRCTVECKIRTRGYAMFHNTCKSMLRAPTFPFPNAIIVSMMQTLGHVALVVQNTMKPSLSSHARWAFA